MSIYVVREQMGTCKLCGEYRDLRMGVCFQCSDYVSGRKIPGGHELWDSRNPANRWVVYDP